MRQYFEQYLINFGNLRTTQVYHDNSRTPKYHRLDQDLINTKLITEADMRRIQQLYQRRLRKYINNKIFYYKGRGEDPFAYKLVGDSIWGIFICPSQNHINAASDICQATVSLGYYNKSLSKRRKPIPTDKEGRSLVHPDSFIWWANLNVVGDRTLDNRGITTIHLETQRNLEFSYKDDDQVIASFDKLVKTWMENFERASQIAQKVP